MLVMASLVLGYSILAIVAMRKYTCYLFLLLIHTHHRSMFVNTFLPIELICSAFLSCIRSFASFPASYFPTMHVVKYRQHILHACILHIHTPPASSSSTPSLLTPSPSSSPYPSSPPPPPPDAASSPAPHSSSPPAPDSSPS